MYAHNVCKSPKQVCQEQNMDLEQAKRLAQQFPSKILTLRYEDLCLDPYGMSAKVFEFLQLPYSKNEASKIINGDLLVCSPLETYYYIQYKIAHTYVH